MRNMDREEPESSFAQDEQVAARSFGRGHRVRYPARLRHVGYTPGMFLGTDRKHRTCRRRV